MAAQRLIRGFIGASALAIYAGCSHTPAIPEKPVTDANVAQPDPEVVAKLRQKFLDRARLEAFNLERATLGFYQETVKIKALAVADKITQDVCRAIDPPDALSQFQNIKDEYASAVAKEVQFGGETEAGQAKRVSIINKVVGQIADNRVFILRACSDKFTI